MFIIDQHIEHLLLKHDCVIAPGFGGFVVHNVPASFDANDGMMLPPTITVGFNPDLKLNDSLLIQSFVEAYDMSYPEAQREVENEINELKALIADHGSYEIHSVGTLSLNADGNYEFEPNKAGILVPRLYALPGIDTTEAETFLAHENAQRNVIAAASSIHQNSTDNVISISTNTLKKIAVACACLFILVSLPLIGQQPDTKRVINQVNASIFSMFMPNENQPEANTTTPKEPYHVYVSYKPQPVVISKKADTTVEEAKPEVAKEVAQPAVQPAIQPTPAPKTPVYTVVLASQVTIANAQDFIARLKAQGVKDVRMIGDQKINRKVVVGSFKNEEDARASRLIFAQQKETTGAWIMKINE